MYPLDKAELEEMSKADRKAAELEQKRMSEPKSQKAGKPAPKLSEAQKVRSAVTAPEPKPQGYKVDNRGRKIPENLKRPAVTNRITDKKNAVTSRGPASESRPKPPADKKLPVAKKGFAAGKELNAEGKAIYDRLIKEGVKPKSALNKALFRQEKAAKVVNKASSSNVPAKDSGLRKSLGISTNEWSKMTQAEKQAAVKKSVASKVPAGAKPIGVGTMKNGKLTFKFDDKQIKSIVEKNKAAKAIKVPSTVVSSKPNVPGKELAVRPKPGAVVAKTAAKKGGAKAAALGAAKFAGRAVTGKAALAATIGSLALGPIQRKLSEGTKGRTTYDNLNAIAERSKKEGTQYTRSGDKPMTNASYGRAIPGAGGATIASIPKASATPRKETQKLRGPVKRTVSAGPTMNYKVETGDTLSGIAKRSGITLSELMALNKKIKDPRKIYRNTNVKIPAPGKVPNPMYTGPVPYRPGSKEAKAYEALRASRKK
jgi:LysM repeat protein